MIEMYVNDLKLIVTTREIAETRLCHPFHVLVKELDLVWLWPTVSNPWDAILRAAGHDPSKIDYAVPQSWFDVQLNKYGMDNWRSQAFWTYENNRFSGDPLYKKHILDKITKTLVENLKESLAEEWIELKECESIKL